MLGQRRETEYDAPTPGRPLSSSTALGQVATRIIEAANQIAEIANKLSDHADRVHGAVPQEAADRDKVAVPDAAMDKIWESLGFLDQTISRVAIEAGRNTTLA